MRKESRRSSRSSRRSSGGPGRVRSPGPQTAWLRLADLAGSACARELNALIPVREPAAELYDLMRAYPGREGKGLRPTSSGRFRRASLGGSCDVVLGIWSSTRPLASRDRRRAPARPAVAITRVHARGEVGRAQSDEYVEVTNHGTRAQDVSGWRLDAGDSGQSFAFGPDTLLAPGQAVRVYTDEVHAESGGFSFGLARAISNDAGDTATLFDTQGTLISQLAYGSQDPSPAP